MSRIVCVGAAGIDRLYRAHDALESGTSNPAAVRLKHGGVARNVAETLARLDHDVEFVSIVGDDAGGAAIICELKNLGVETRHVVRSREHRTAEYAAILRPNGELELGAADVSILDTFGPAELERAHAAFAGADFIFADCNLSSAALETLPSLARTTHGRLAVDAVSVAKAQRLPHALDGIDLLFVNAAEAAALAGTANAKPEDASRALHGRGAAVVIIGLGSRGALVVDEAGARTIDPLPAMSIVDVTGAGDALIAGTIHATLGGATLDDAVRAGVFLATLTLGCEGSVRPDLSRDLLKTERLRTAIEAR